MQHKGFQLVTEAKLDLTSFRLLHGVYATVSLYLHVIGALKDLAAFS